MSSQTEETMKNDRKLILMAVAIALTVTTNLAAGKVSYSTFSLATPNASAGSDHRETIEIASWSLGATNATAQRGKTHVNEGVLRFTANSVPPSAARLCTSKAVVPSLTVEADGQVREFRDVVFKECPTAATGGTFTLTFNGQTTAPSSARPKEIANVTISGFSRMSSANNIRQIGIAAHQATIYVGSANGGVWKTTDGGVPSKGQKYPRIVIQGKGGTQVEFLEVTLEDVMVTSWQTSAHAGGSSEVQKITISFASTTATQPLVDALIAGR
jgi:hypothetical protein